MTKNRYYYRFDDDVHKITEVRPDLSRRYVYSTGRVSHWYAPHKAGSITQQIAERNWKAQTPVRCKRSAANLIGLEKWPSENYFRNIW